MGVKLLRLADPEQPANQTAVIEMQLRHLDESLAQIRVKRRQSKHDEASFEDAEPSLCGGLRDPTISR